VRNAAFEKALRAVIRKGETTVADIGAGTGLLGLMAAKLGAREVFLYEVAEVAGVAAKLLKANRVRNCHLIPCHSTEMVDQPKVDVVVSETLGNFALEEHIVETLADAKKRFLAPGGIMIPRALDQFVAPVISNRLHRDFAVWDATGLDMSFARTMSLNNIYVRTLKSNELLEAKVWDSVVFGDDRRSKRQGEARWKLTAPTTVYGFAVWWKAELVPGVDLSTAPDAPRTHWEQLYFPLLEPLAGKTRDEITVSIRTRTSQAAGTDVAWSATHRDANGRETSRQQLDLGKGYLP